MKSQIIDAEINGMKVKLIAVVRGEKARTIREELGRDKAMTQDLTGRDFDGFEDYASGFPQAAAAIRDAGIDTSNVYAIVEVH